MTTKPGTGAPASNRPNRAPDGPGDAIVDVVTGTVADIMRRPDNVAFKPVRINIAPPPAGAADWVINDIQIVHFVDEYLLGKAYADRRKAGRKIRQQRRKIRRLNAGGDARPDDFERSVPPSVASGAMLFELPRPGRGRRA